MTIAIDIKTGAVVGQVVNTRLHEMSDAELLTVWANSPEGFYETSRGSTVTILSRDGYKVLSAHAVRLEKVS